MRIRFSILLFSIFMLVACLLSGCQTIRKFGEWHDSTDPNRGGWLVSHRSPFVSVPAMVGLACGVIISLPPVAVILTGEAVVIEFVHVKDENLDVIAGVPMLITSVMGEYSLGVPCWMLFGWWWPKKEPIKLQSPEQKPVKPNHSEEEKTEQPPLTTEHPINKPMASDHGAIW